MTFPFVIQHSCITTSELKIQLTVEEQPKVMKTLWGLSRMLLTGFLFPIMMIKGHRTLYVSILIVYMKPVQPIRGAEMLELDVHLSQDGQVVVAHDQVRTLS